jgi:hypothetical protein
MAKQKPDLTDIFARTEPGPSEAGRPIDNSDLDNGNVRPLGVGLRAGEVAALDQIANQYGVARNALLRFAVRYFLLQFRAGRVDLIGQVETPPPPKKKLTMPK